jgi:hypothetical protein
MSLSPDDYELYTRLVKVLKGTPDFEQLVKVLEGTTNDARSRLWALLLKTVFDCEVSGGKSESDAVEAVFARVRQATEDVMVAKHLGVGTLPNKDIELKYARRIGDWEPLAEKVASDAPLSADERAFIADALRGKVKRPANRVQSRATIVRKVRMTWAVSWQRLRGASAEQAVATVAEQFNTDPRTVRRAASVLRRPNDKAD